MQCMGIINKSILLACLLAHIIRGGGKERKIGSDIYTKKKKSWDITICDEQQIKIKIKIIINKEINKNGNVS